MCNRKGEREDSDTYFMSNALSPLSLLFLRKSNGILKKNVTLHLHFQNRCVLEYSRRSVATSSCVCLRVT